MALRKKEGKKERKKERKMLFMSMEGEENATTSYVHIQRVGF